MTTKKTPTKKKTAVKKVKSTAAKVKKKTPARSSKPQVKVNGVVLLSGGNPQIAKGDGDEPVQAYIAAMPGWKKDIGVAVDKLIEATVPKLEKCVRWNSPFYSCGQGAFVSAHCFNKFVRLTFFKGTSLDPMPPGSSKTPDTRYYDIYEGQLDEKQLESWIRQASKIPGWVISA